MEILEIWHYKQRFKSEDQPKDINIEEDSGRDCRRTERYSQHEKWLSEIPKQAWKTKTIPKDQEDLFILKNILEKKLETGEELYIAFVDLKAVFDSVDRLKI